MRILKFKNKITRAIIFLLISVVSITNVVYADSNKSNLELKLEEQEEKLKEDMSDFLPEEDNTIGNIANDLAGSEIKGQNNIRNIAQKLADLIKELLIRSRTIVIILYGLFLLCILIYIATVGSRSLDKRRHGMLLLIGNTILFIVYINIPLLIIYFEADKSGLEKVSMYKRIVDTMNFISKNSVIISSLLAFLGISKLIVSKNDLPMRMQGQYLIKFAFILLIALNIIPLAIHFIL